MIHTCFICKKEISNELAEAQNRAQLPGNYLACEKHTQEVATLNLKMRELQRLRGLGYSDESLAIQIQELRDLKAQYRVE